VEFHPGIAVFLIITLIVKLYERLKMFEENGFLTFGIAIGVKVGHYNKCYKSYCGKRVTHQTPVDTSGCL